MNYDKTITRDLAGAYKFCETDIANCFLKGRQTLEINSRSTVWNKKDRTENNRKHRSGIEEVNNPEHIHKHVISRLLWTTENMDDHFGHWSSTDFDNTMIYSAFGPTYERVMKYLCYYFTCRTGLVWIQASSVL